MGFSNIMMSMGRLTFATLWLLLTPVPHATAEEPLLKTIDRQARTDTVQEKLNLIQRAYDGHRYDLALSLAESLKETLACDQQLLADPGRPEVDVNRTRGTDQLPPAWAAWARGWKYVQSVTLREPADLTRRQEPVDIRIAVRADQSTDLHREIRVARIETPAFKLREIPSQVYGAVRRGNRRNFHLVFFADIPAGERATFLIFHGNPLAERPRYPTDLQVEGDRFVRKVANHHFVATLSDQMGQLTRLRYTRQHGLELYAGGKGHGEPPTIDWSNDYVDQDHYQKLRIRNWSQPPNYDVVRGPLVVRLRRWGFPHSPIHPVFTPSRMHIDQTYVFYAGRDYFLKEGTMEAVKDFDFTTMRDDEWVFSGYSFNRKVWIDSEGKLQEGEVPQSQSRSMGGVGFYHDASRDALVALWIEHSIQGYEQIEENGAPTLHYHQHGQLWSRYPVRDGKLKFQQGTVLKQQNAYLVAPYPKQGAAQQIEGLRNRLLRPLEMTAREIPHPAEASATGQLARQGETASTAPLKGAIWQALRGVRDEQLYRIDGNVVDLGYIYDVRVKDGVVEILMTMPHRGRPVYQYLVTQGGGHTTEGIREQLLRIDGVRDVLVHFTWEPAWTTERLTDAGRLALGLEADASELVLVDHGVAYATIVVPVTCPEKVMVAAKDIQNTIERSTGVSLSIVEEGQAVSGTRLFVGPGSWANSLNVTIPTGTRFHDEQIVVKRIGFDVVIVGNDDGPLVGTQDAAIRFLNVVVGADYYYPSPLGQSVPKTSRLTVGKVDLSERPALVARQMAMYGLKNSDPQRVPEDQWRRWNHFGGVPFAHSHAHAAIAPPKVYFMDHPEYYSEVRGERSVSRGWQLCTTNPEVIQLGVAHARRFLDERPSVFGASLSPNDGSGMCTCPECSKLDYPDPISRGARRMVTYANAVARELAKTHPGKYVAFYAYLHTVEPPMDMKLEPNVIVVLADSKNCMFHSYDDASCGLARDARQRLEGWSKIATNIKLYDYHGLHGDYSGLPFSNIHRLIANARVAQRLGGLGYYYDALFMPGPQGLHYWTALRTLWDAEMTADQARQRYCDGLYGNASQAMQTYYRHLEVFCTKTAAHSVHVTWVMPGPFSIWTDEAITTLRSDLDKAAAMVSPESTEFKRIGEQTGFIDLAERFVHLKRVQRAYWHDETQDNANRYDKARQAYLDLYKILRDQGLLVLRQSALNAYSPEDPRHQETSVEITRTPKPPHSDPLDFSDPTWIRYGYRVYSFKDNDDFLAYPKTRGRLTYDDNALYVRLEAIDYNLSRLTTDVQDRDGDVWQDDCVRLSIAVPGQSKQRVRYDFFVNADGVIRDVREGEIQWNGDWRATVGRSDVHGDRKWAVRMEIPWSTLGLSSVPTTFRMNLFRHTTTECVSPVSIWEPTFDSLDTASRYVQVTTID